MSSVGKRMDNKDGTERVLSRRNPRKRVKSKHGDYGRMFECETCSKGYTTRAALIIHARSHAVQHQERCLVGRKRNTRQESRAVCNLCQESFVNQQVLKAHLRRHTGERPYVCTLCEKTFTQRSALMGHMATHANDKFKCPECDLVFTQMRSLKRHAKYHTGELEMKRKNRSLYQQYKVRVPLGSTATGDTSYQDVYRCDFCSKEFKMGNQLVTHRRTHTGERPFECGVCGRRFKQKITLTDHEATHLRFKPHKCDKCGSLFKQERTLKRHMKAQICDKKNVHTSKGMVKEIDPIEVKHWTGAPELEGIRVDSADGVNCGPGAVVVNVTNDLQPSLMILEDDPQKAESVISDAPVDAAMNVSHDEAVAAPCWICQHCGKVLKNKKSVQQHLKTHTSEKPFLCTVCYKGFKLRRLLVSHMVSHTEGRPHACQTCGKRFKMYKSLQNHIGRNICTGARPFACEICKKTFMYARYLEKHSCAAKVFQCTECHKTFTRKRTLTEHLRVHAGEYPLECEDCGKTFAKRDLLRRHRVIHKERQFACQECGKRFASKPALQRHSVVHSDERKYVCGICQKKFKQPRSLRNHYKSLHNPTNIRPSAYLCSNCGKEFKHLKRMLQHYCPATHAKRFQCQVCEKSFAKKQQLDVHFRIHSGIRPYECLECHKTFTQSGSLSDHMVTHTGVKMHRCDQCGSEFTRKNSLQRHKLIIHQGVEPFICKKCGLTFKYKKSFDGHVDICTASGVEQETSIEHEGLVPQAGEVLHPQEVEQQVLDSILGNIERAMNGAGIEIRDNVQYQIVVGDESGEVMVHVGTEQQ